MKQYADEKNHAKDHSFQVGDTVLVRQKKQNKLTSAFSPIHYVITQVKGSMITAKRDNHYITRNCSFFKHIQITKNKTDRDLGFDDMNCTDR